MTPEQLRRAAIKKLHADGATIHPDAKTPAIVSAIEKLTGRVCTHYMSPPDFVRSFVSPAVPARQLVAFRPMRPRAHPRLAEIDAAQPPLYTPDGVGNGAERQHGYGRGV